MDKLLFYPMQDAMSRWAKIQTLLFDAAKISVVTRFIDGVQRADPQMQEFDTSLGCGVRRPQCIRSQYFRYSNQCKAIEIKMLNHRIALEEDSDWKLDPQIKRANCFKSYFASGRTHPFKPKGRSWLRMETGASAIRE
jgi:hypothetical protein